MTYRKCKIQRKTGRLYRCR